MFDHERFRELSSLAAIGQLSADENVELEKHLLECESCREVRNDYSYLIQHQLPRADVISWGRKSIGFGFPSDSEVRDRFFGRARAEGVEFSAVAERPNRRNHVSIFSSSPIRWLAPVVATCAAVAVMFLAPSLLRRPQLTSPSYVVKAVGQATLENENKRLREQVQTLSHTIESQLTQSDEIRRESALSKESLQQLEMQLQRVQQQRDELLARIETVDSERTALAHMEQQEEAVIANLRTQNDELDRQGADNLSDLVIERQRIRELSRSLEKETDNLERERQLMAITNDVRQLMGARNLHIMDVRDVNAESKSAKAFGRVFYAEGQVLIFYAFDLPSEGLSPAKYTFHAWGSRDLDSQSPRNLGTFEVDDHEQHRWILKVDDPALLAGVESVFVTAESLRDVTEPRGRKLLYAYIAGQQNHP